MDGTQSNLCDWVQEIKAAQLLKYQRHKELDLGVPKGDILGFLVTEKLVKFSTG